MTKKWHEHAPITRILVSNEAQSASLAQDLPPIEEKAKFDAATYQRALDLYPGDAVMQPILATDGKVFTDAVARIQAAMATSPSTTLNREPIYFLSLRAQVRYGYGDSTSN